MLFDYVFMFFMITCATLFYILMPVHVSLSVLYILRAFVTYIKTLCYVMFFKNIHFLILIPALSALF